MGGCCGGGPAEVLVEFEYLVVSGETCDRCGDTRTAVRAAVRDAQAGIPASMVRIELVERELSPERLADSNRVLVNGVPAEEWLGGVAVMTDCPSCAEIVGEPACCREVEVAGVRTEAVGRDLIFDAIMTAAGLAPAGASGEDCCSTADEEPVTAPASSCCGGHDKTPEPTSCCGGAEKAAGDASCGCAGDAGPSAERGSRPSVTLVTGPGCG